MIAPKPFVGRLGMPKISVVAIRIDDATFRACPVAGAGRSDRLREDFLADMHDAWLEHEPEGVDRVIADMSPLGQQRNSLLRHAISALRSNSDVTAYEAGARQREDQQLPQR